jgi:hypothetical protein
MSRRHFLTLLAGAAAAWPFTGRAQESRTYRIGVLNNNPRGSPVVAAVFDELRRNGVVEGRNLIVVEPGIGVPYPEFGEAARELANKNIEALVVGGGPPQSGPYNQCFPPCRSLG